MPNAFHTSVMFTLTSVLLMGCGASGCSGARHDPPAMSPEPMRIPLAAHAQPAAHAPDTTPARDLQGGTVEAGPPPAGLSVATFAGGCFWCMEAAFEHLPGVRDAISGYTGGPELHPSYEQVSNHRTQQAEAVRVLYDPRAVTYEQLLDLYWRRVDPVDRDRAFADTGHQYRSVIFVHDAQQRAAAERSLREISASGRYHAPVLTTVEDAPVFWVAEDYHQNFWRTSPEHYTEYHENSGRREFLRAVWGPDAPY